jgi:glycosyltransferase involved in cell wall biosynthesis
MPMIVSIEGRGCRNACICLTTARKFGRLEENGCGFTLTPGDGEALARRILALASDRALCASMGARARMAFERQWDKQQALAKWEALLQTLSPSSSRLATKHPAD